MYSHFYTKNIYHKRQIVELRKEFDKNKKIFVDDFSKNFSKQMLKGRSLRHLHVYDDDFLKNLIKGEIKRDPLSIRLLQAIKDFKNS
jgi:hypothetical protein